MVRIPGSRTKSFPKCCFFFDLCLATSRPYVISQVLRVEHLLVSVSSLDKDVTTMLYAQYSISVNLNPDPSWRSSKDANSRTMNVSYIKTIVFS